MLILAATATLGSEQVGVAAAVVVVVVVVPCVAA